MKISILIRALSTGGAERQAAALAKGLQNKGHQVTLMVFYGGGELEADLHQSGVRLIDLGKKGRWDNLSFMARLVQTVRTDKPDVLYSFLTVANILTGLLGPCFFPKVRRVFGLRASNMDYSRYDRLNRLSNRLENLLSSKADLVICNSSAGRQQAEKSGFSQNQLRLVRNGIDIERFHPDQEKGRKVRTEWGINQNQILIGLVGRLDPMKGHPEFIKAAGMLHSKYPNARFVCIGNGPPEYRKTLLEITQSEGINDILIMTGNRDDMPEVYNALDILVSASLFGEGVSNALSEAMASGIPCVTTDVGDSAWVVGQTGQVVPPGDPEALANGIHDMILRLQQQGIKLKLAARQHIEANLGLDALVENTRKVLESIL